MAFKDKKRETEYITGYIKESYDRIEIRAPKGYKQLVADAAKRDGMSTNKWILAMIEEKLQDPE